MKYLKKYENQKRPDYDEGDTIICIANDGQKDVLEVGKKYIVKEVFNKSVHYRVKTLEPDYRVILFGLEGYHFNIERFISELEYEANKYNI